SGCFRLDTTEAELRQIELLDKHVDCANRIIIANPVLQAFREQRALPSIRAFNEPLHLSLNAEKSNHRHRRFLRACRERPCRRSRKSRDELASSQSVELHTIHTS